MTDVRKLAPALVACVALLSAGIANIDVKPTKTVVVHDKPRIVEKVRTKVVRVPEKVRQPDGYMSADDCAGLAKRTDFRDVIFRFGWPAGKNAEDSYAGFLIYPLSDDHTNSCWVDFWEGGVESTEVRQWSA